MKFRNLLTVLYISEKKNNPRRSSRKSANSALKMINKKLLAIKGHYLLRCAGTAPLVLLLPLMVRDKGLSEQTLGLLWTLLPVVGLIANSISGMLADYFRAHRAVFLSSLVSLTTGIISIYWIPKLSSSVEASETTLSSASFENATLRSSTLIPGNNSLLIMGLEAVDTNMAVGEGQNAPSQKVESKDLAQDLASLVYYPQFWLIFLALMAEQIGISVCVMMADTVCFQILGSERHKYGWQRLWGTIGMGLMAIVSGALIDIFSQGLPKKDYLPAIIICFVLMLADVVLVARMRIPYSSDEKLVMGDVGSTLKHPHGLLYLLTMYVMGTSLGIVWVFKLMMVEDVALDWNAEFPALKLLQGLVLGIETFLGEVPFFIFSGKIISRLGYTSVMVTSLFSMGLRCCLYYAVTNPWWFLPIELLNGPSYSLFHSSMASYASHIAPPGAQATLQSIFRATLWMGLSTAGLLGGVLYNSFGGSVTFLQVGSFDLVYVLFFILLSFLIKKYCNRDQVAREVGCVTVQDKDNMETCAGNAEEVMKELLEKDCAERMKNVTKAEDGFGDESSESYCLEDRS